MEVRPRNIDVYQHDDTAPFDDWLDSLDDRKGVAQIDVRINRLRRGLLGNYKHLGDGILELRLDNVGPGYRIYCADDGHNCLILCGGKKKTQQADIEYAKKFWKEYKQHNA